MRAYDPSKPLVFCHVPRSGGGSCRAAFRQMFGAGYFDDAPILPEADIAFGSRKLVASHYGRWLGYSVCRARPSAAQFVTFLRDPFMRALSWYYYWKREFAGKARVQGAGPYGIDKYPTLEDYVLTCIVTLVDFLPIRERWSDFVFVGRTDRLYADFGTLAGVLGKPCVAVAITNVGTAEPPLGPERMARLRKMYVVAHPEEFDAYRELTGAQR